MRTRLIAVSHRGIAASGVVVDSVEYKQCCKI